MSSERYDIDGQPLTVRVTKINERLPQGYPIPGDYEDGVIRIDPRQSKAAQRATLLHEVMHHCWARSVLPGRFKTADEELIITELSHWLMAASDSAPDLIARIFDHE